MLNEISKNDLEEINGGGLAGGLAGYVIGCEVGALVGAVCSSISRGLGDSDDIANDVGLVAFGATVAVCTFVGALLPG